MKTLSILVIFSLSLCASNTFASDLAGKHHALGFFLGNTNAANEDEFSYGLEYEYRFNQLWGAGVTYEKTDDAHDGDGIDIKVASLYWHPWKTLRLGLGLGKESVGGHGSESLKRFSLSYDFHLKENWGIAPTFAIDEVDGHHARVYGVAIVYSF